jgi:hypothetical protein
MKKLIAISLISIMFVAPILGFFLSYGNPFNWDFIAGCILSAVSIIFLSKIIAFLIDGEIQE